MKTKMRGDLMYDVLDAAESYREEGILNLNEQGILIRVMEHSNTAIYNSYIPAGAMDVWEPGEFPRIGMQFENFTNFLPNSKDDIVLTIEEGRGQNYKYNLSVGQREYTLPVTDPDTVRGNPEKVPDLDCNCVFKVEWSWIKNFITDLRKIYTDKEGGHIYFSPREEGVYLWGYEDDSEIKDFKNWDDMEDFSVDWDSMEKDQEGGLNPPEDHGADTIMSLPYIDNIVSPTDKIRVEMDNHYPMKFVAEREEGVKQSWIIPPRFPTEETEYTLPERLIR